MSDSERDKSESDLAGDADVSDGTENDRSAVRDLPDPEPRELTEDDLTTLRDAGLGELAELGKRYV